VTRIICLVLFTASMNDTCHKQITQYLTFMFYTTLKQFWEDCNWTSSVSMLLRKELSYKIMFMKNKSITNTQASTTVKKHCFLWCDAMESSTDLPKLWRNLLSPVYWQKDPKNCWLIPITTCHHIPEDLKSNISGHNLFNHRYCAKQHCSK